MLFELSYTKFIFVMVICNEQARNMKDGADGQQERKYRESQERPNYRPPGERNASLQGSCGIRTRRDENAHIHRTGLRGDDEDVQDVCRRGKRPRSVSRKQEITERTSPYKVKTHETHISTSNYDYTIDKDMETKIYTPELLGHLYDNRNIHGYNKGYGDTNMDYNNNNTFQSFFHNCNKPSPKNTTK